MECSVIVSLVEFVDSDAETTPKNPAFEIRFGLFYDQVVAETKALRADAEGDIKVRHDDILGCRTSKRRTGILS